MTPTVAKKSKSNIMKEGDVVDLKTAREYVESRAPNHGHIKTIATHAWLHNKANVYKLHHGIFKAAILPENHYVLHPIFDKFTVHRDKEGKITSVVSYPTSEIIEGDSLKWLFLLEVVRATNVEFFIYDDVEGPCSYFMVPGGMKVVEHTFGEDLVDKRRQVRGTVYTHKSQFLMYGTPKEFLDYLNTPFLSLPKINEIVATINAMLRVNDSLDSTKLADLAGLQSLIADGDSKRKKTALLDVLYASALAGSTLEEKIAAFVAHPSTNFALRLKLPSIYSGALIRQSSRQTIPYMRIADIADTESVMFSQTPISTLEINRMKGDPLDQGVMMWYPDAGTQLKKVFKTAEGVTLKLEKSLALEYVKALSECNNDGKGKKSTDAEGPAVDLTKFTRV